MFYSVRILLCLCLFTAFSSANAESISHEGKEFSRIEKVTAAPDVVEFFSFYCMPCYLFSQKYHVPETVQASLPERMTFKKYHVSQMGAAGNELTQAWAVAMSLGIEDKMQPLLFEGVRKSNKSITANDIAAIFQQAGISAKDYELAKESLAVKALVKQQDKAVKDFNVSYTPSFYVSGQYRIINQGIEGLDSNNLDTYAKEYAAVIRHLLNIPDIFPSQQDFY